MSIDAEVRVVLADLQARVASGEDGAIYGDRQRALADIEAALAYSDIGQVKRLLAPAGNVQELSIENGWGAEFLAIASRLERLLGS